MLSQDNNSRSGGGTLERGRTAVMLARQVTCTPCLIRKAVMSHVRQKAGERGSWGSGRSCSTETHDPPDSSLQTRNLLPISTLHSSTPSHHSPCSTSTTADPGGPRGQRRRSRQVQESKKQPKNLANLHRKQGQERKEGGRRAGR